MGRTKASLSHFLVSLTIFTVVVLVLRNFWYPTPYFDASGGWQGLTIVAGIDLVLGPLLTFVVFNTKKSKRELVTDLSIIIIFQFAALAWGIHTIYQQRPVAVVFWENEFLSVPASALSNQDISTEILKPFGNQNPVLIYAEKPTTVEGLKKMTEIVIIQQLPPHHQVNLYQPFAPHFNDIKSFQVSIDEIITHNKQMKNGLEEILATRQSKIDDYEYYPLKSKYRNIILIFTHNGKLVEHLVVPLRSTERKSMEVNGVGLD